MRSLVLSRGVDPQEFGRKARPPAAVAAPVSATSDLRLFLWTFACGFVFMTVFLA